MFNAMQHIGRYGAPPSHLPAAPAVSAVWSGSVLESVVVMCLISIRSVSEMNICEACSFCRAQSFS